MKHFFILTTIIILVTLIYIGRISYFQLFTDRYKLNANNTSIKAEYDIPLRGIITDRNGKVLVGNILSYEISYTQSMIDKQFDTLVFCKLIEMNKKDFIKKTSKLNTNIRYKKNIPQIFLKSLNIQDIAKVQEKIYKFPAFSIVRRPTRTYKVNGAGNILGYINEVNESYIKSDSTYYLPGDLAGISGVERSYEKILRGVKGIRYYKKDIHQQSIGSYENGKFNVEAINGKDLTLTIDYNLQQYAEELLEGKFGAVVAIDPNNGEILCLASSPTINLNKFESIKSKKKYLHKFLNDSISKPMYDRATQATYPPGSTFKLVNALVAQQLKIVTDSTIFFCKNGSRIGRKFVRCHDKGSIQLVSSIENSCNSYYCKLYIKMLELYCNNIEKSIDTWNKYVMSFGMNQFFGNDLYAGSKGNIPDSKFYNKWYKKGTWTPYSIFSNGIGQGEILTTPLQMANFTAAIANQGFYYTPHIVKLINGKLIKNFIHKKNTKVNKKYFPKVIEGMIRVLTSGTARNIFTKSFTQAGKTGTSQMPYGQQDHSNFVMFAPINKPKIAIAVVIQNGGFGSRSAAPIASLVAEKYLLKKIKRTSMENFIKKMSLYNEYKRIHVDSLKKKKHS